MAKRNTNPRHATIAVPAADFTLEAEMAVVFTTSADGRIAHPKDTADLPPISVLFACTPEGQHAAEVRAKRVRAAREPRNKKLKEQWANRYRAIKREHPGRGDLQIAGDLAKEFHLNLEPEAALKRQRRALGLKA